MTHGPTNIDSKDKCIYCYDSNVELTDEHIVPFSLGGVHIIQKASCLKCNKITTKFERKVARDLWGDARISYDAPSRRKKNRKDFISMGNSEIPASEYPAGLVFYEMNIPGILQGLAEDVDISKLWKMVVIHDDKRMETFLKENANKPTLSFRNVPQEFGQLLAKIGYGQVLTRLDLDDFNPICLPYITGEKSNVSYVVGGVLTDAQPIKETGYILNTKGIIISDNRLLLIAEVRLYSNTHAPGYQIIVGEILGSENITRVIKKMNSTEKVIN
ncbi:MAG: hypothetical protein JKX80_02045 [Candidatus Pacebacteria bacterium]|nr:hypothetical protein [Candidatus Paceibacterota bacterium]